MFELFSAAPRGSLPLCLRALPLCLRVVVSVAGVAVATAPHAWRARPVYVYVYIPYTADRRTTARKTIKRNATEDKVRRRGLVCSLVMNQFFI